MSRSVLGTVTAIGMAVSLLGGCAHPLKTEDVQEFLDERELEVVKRDKAAQEQVAKQLSSEEFWARSEKELGNLKKVTQVYFDMLGTGQLPGVPREADARMQQFFMARAGMRRAPYLDARVIDAFSNCGGLYLADTLLTQGRIQHLFCMTGESIHVVSAWKREQGGNWAQVLSPTLRASDPVEPPFEGTPDRTAPPHTP
jgi:hypothetical protein